MDSPLAQTKSLANYDQEITKKKTREINAKKKKKKKKSLILLLTQLTTVDNSLFQVRLTNKWEYSNLKNKYSIYKLILLVNLSQKGAEC